VTKRSIVLQDYFNDMEDPRIDRNKLHSLWDIIVLVLCAVICHCESWEEIEDYGIAKLNWLRRFIPLSNGIPSRDTIRRVFSRFSSQEITKRFMEWTEALRETVDREVVAIDGKTLRGSYDRTSGTGALHVLSAWASENRLVLGQLPVEIKENEILAIPRLLELLELKGAIVTIDAMGCQKDITHKIVERGADYVIGLKGNQATLHQDAADFFREFPQPHQGSGHDTVTYKKTLDKGHGRIEVREYAICDDIAWLMKDRPGWSSLRSIGWVRSKRTIGEKETMDVRYYITSLSADVDLFEKAVRSHWGIENSVHHVLDVSFREDQSRVHDENAPLNLAIFRHLALNIMRRDTKNKRSLKGRRKRCGWDDSYLESLLLAADPLPTPSSTI
jgi:predicted transposase YbfD/YdcC